ncbi:MAG: hypothetical protein R2795_04180 [Saprospiraceae bacterium]
MWLLDEQLRDITIVAPPDTTRLAENICRGDTIYVGATPLFETGFYTQRLPAFAGCDSIVTLDLQVTEIPVTDLDQTICQGDMFGWAIATHPLAFIKIL